MKAHILIKALETFGANIDVMIPNPVNGSPCDIDDIQEHVITKNDSDYSSSCEDRQGESIILIS